MMRRARFASAAFTLVELMIVVAVVAIIAALAAPSFRDMILSQRLQGINAQLATDLAFARSEAVSRGVFVGVRTQANGTMSCYIINTRTTLDALPCDCTAAAGTRCNADPTNTTEIRTVQVPTSLLVLLEVPAAPNDNFTFDPRTGGRKVRPADLAVNNFSDFVVRAYINDARARELRTVVRVSGRISVCTPNTSPMAGPAC